MKFECGKVTYVTLLEGVSSILDKDKLQRLAYISKRYYLENQKQSEIADELGVSRPLISRMLSEARELGIVEITIHSPDERQEALLERLYRSSSIKTGILVLDGVNDVSTNQSLSQSTFLLLDRLASKNIGIGWGHFIGEMVNCIEKAPLTDSKVKHVCPLVGNAGVPIRNYHTNENVRVLSDGLGAEPTFLYLPAFAESKDEKDVLCSTELYRQMEKQWAQMDTALVNIGNYPSTPDFASVARYGNILQRRRACGRLLAYFYNEQGEILHSDHDFAIQIPLEDLARCKNIVGLCSANTNVRALRGALNTGIFTHLVAREQLIMEYFS